MKSILISIKPQWVAKILNGEKTIEIRKTAPKCELPIDVYIYCTKTIKPVSRYDWGEFTFNDLPKLGKIVAKFTLNGIDKFTEGLSEFEYERLTPGEIARSGRPYYKKVLRRACLTDEELQRYAPDKSFYAWYIEDLVIFDEPKELDEFDYPNPSGIRNIGQRSIKGLPSKKHPPQSWCYVEERE